MANDGKAPQIAGESRPFDRAVAIEALLDATDDVRIRQLGAAGDRERTILDLVEQTIRLTMVNADSAQDAAALVVTIADEHGSPLAQARARRAQVRALSYAGRYDEALAAGEAGVAIALRSNLTAEAGRIRLATMHALTEAGRLQDALREGESARSAFASSGEAALAAKAEINLGVVHQRRDSPADAVACFDRAWPVLQDDPLTLGHLQNNRGEALVALNDFLGAEQAFAAALDAFETAGADLTAAIAQGNLADLAMRNGRFHQAVSLFERARRRFESAQSPGHLARILAEQAEARSLIGMFDEALREYQQALKQLDECKLPLESSRARSGMGRVLIRLGRFSDAETALAAAATGFSELGHQTARARVDLHRAELAAHQGRVAEARSMALRSLSVLDARPVDAVAARHALARFALAQGDRDIAGAELTAALATARRYVLRPLIADLLVTQGQWHEQNRRIDKAIACWHEAIDAIERVRSTLQARRFRTAFLGERTAAYERLVGALLERQADGDLYEAFTVAERCKCRSLSERDESDEADLSVIAGSEAVAHSPGAPSPNDPCVESNRLRAELNGLYSMLADDRTSRIGPDEYERLLCAVRETEHALRACEARIDAVGGGVLAAAPPARADVLQQIIREDDAVVEFFTIDAQFVVFVLTPSRLHVAKLQSTAEIELLLARVQFQIDRALRPGAMDGDRAKRLTADAQRAAQALHNALILPLKPFVGDAKRLLIVPHGVIHRVPFAALFDGQQYLVDQFDLRTYPNATLIGTRGGGESRSGSDIVTKQTRALIVAVGDADAPEIEREAEAVAAALSEFQIDALVGRDATADRVCASAEEADLLHFACHGEFSTALPFGSGLKLADRWLTPRDLAGRSLRARLVVLSACESGRSRIESGDELTGLMRGFLSAGAGAIIMSQWRVHDESSLDFMRFLYETWIGDLYLSESQEWDGRQLDAAVRNAMCRVRERLPHPAFWAAFQLAGGGV